MEEKKLALDGKRTTNLVAGESHVIICCDKGDLAAVTDLNRCTDCGVCVEACYFRARTMAAGKLALDAALCYGCGLCVAVCPEEWIDMG